MELEFDKKMEPAIQVINEALAEFGAVGLSENSEILINQELLLENYLQFEIRRNTNHVPLMFIISGGNIRIDIDRAEEISEWPLDLITEDKNKILSFLTSLFTSYVLIEHYGASHTRISFFNKDGECIDTYKYQQGLSFKGKRKVRLYFPVYSLKESTSEV